MAQKKRIQRVRSITKVEKPNESRSIQFQEFPKDKPGVIYVRQSTIAQVRKNLHSYEMQTDEFVKFFREQKGVTGHIEIVADDEGKSGSLDIHDREGLSRVMRLIQGEELLVGAQIGWVGAINVTRLTRDKWLVVPGTLMRACAENEVWISTLRMDFNFSDDYCRRVFILEAEEAAKYLEWQREVLQGGRLVASSKGVYDGRHVAYGYVVDYREKLEDGEPNPTFKNYLVYEPHAKVVKWIFRRYLELGGNFTALCREVDALPYLFPAFEKGVDTRWITRCAGYRTMIKEGRYKGCFKPTRSGLMSLLTNPVYVGWWIPQGGGLIEQHHPGIVDETLFSYAHRRLSSHNLQGVRVKPQRATRNGKTQALLKKVLVSPLPEHHIYTGETAGVLYYVLKYVGPHAHRTLLHVRTDLLDEEFTFKFFERLQGWIKRGELDRWKERAEQEHAEAQLARGKRADVLRKEITQATARRQELWIL